MGLRPGSIWHIAIPPTYSFLRVVLGCLKHPSNSWIINYVTRDCTHQTGHRLLRVMNKDIDAAVMISITPQQHRNACILPWQLSSLQGPSFRDALLDYISQSPRVFRWGPITRFQQWNGSERNLAKSLKSRLSPLHQWITFMKQITWK